MPLARATAELEQAEMCPFVSRRCTSIRSSSAAYSSRTLATWGRVEQSSAMHSSQFV